MDSFPCPSFNAYTSSGNDTSISIADIADRVTGEDRDECGSLLEAQPRNEEDGDGEDDFEFLTLRKRCDEVYLESDGVGPVYPVFNRDLLVDYQSRERRKSNEESSLPEDNEEVTPLQIPLRDLFMDSDNRLHRDIDPHSSSSSDAGDLDQVPAGSYDARTPDSPKRSPSSCRKSKSTGSSSSRRWKFLDLLRRSNSDGKDSFVFLSPSASANKKAVKSDNSKEQKWSSSSASAGTPNRNWASGKSKAKASPTVKGRGNGKISAHEEFYVRNRAMKEIDKRRSYLPYKQDLVGFCATLGGSLGGRTFPPL